MKKKKLKPKPLTLEKLQELFPELTNSGITTLDAHNEPIIAKAIYNRLDGYIENLDKEFPDSKKEEWKKNYEKYSQQQSEELVAYFRNTIKVIQDLLKEISNRVKVLQKYFCELELSGSLKKGLSQSAISLQEHLFPTCTRAVDSIANVLSRVFFGHKRPDKDINPEPYNFKFDIFSLWPKLKEQAKTCQEYIEIIYKRIFSKEISVCREYLDAVKNFQATVDDIEKNYLLSKKEHDAEEQFNTRFSKLLTQISTIGPKSPYSLPDPNTKKKKKQKEKEKEEKENSTSVTESAQTEASSAPDERTADEDTQYEFNLSTGPVSQKKLSPHNELIGQIINFNQNSRSTIKSFLKASKNNWKKQTKSGSPILDERIETLAESIDQLYLESLQIKNKIETIFSELFSIDANQETYKNSLISDFFSTCKQLENFWQDLALQNEIYLAWLNRSYQDYLQSRNSTADDLEKVTGQTGNKSTRDNLSKAGKLFRSSNALKSAFEKWKAKRNTELPSTLVEKSEQIDRKFLQISSTSMAAQPSPAQGFIDFIFKSISQGQTSNTDIKLVLHGGWLRYYLLYQSENPDLHIDVDFILVHKQPDSLRSNLLNNFWKETKNNIYQIYYKNRKIDLLIIEQTQNIDQAQLIIPHFLGMSAIYWDNSEKMVIDPTPNKEGLYQLFNHLLEPDPRLSKEKFIKLLGNTPTLLLRLVQYACEGWQIGPKLEASLPEVKIGPLDEGVKNELNYMLLKFAKRDYSILYLLPENHPVTRLLMEFKIAEKLFGWKEKSPEQLALRIEDYTKKLQLQASETKKPDSKTKTFQTANNTFFESAPSRKETSSPLPRKTMG